MKHTNAFALAGLLLSSPALASEGGLPQMDVSTYPSQLFWLFVCFVVLYVVMSKVSLPRVGQTLDNRKSQREGNLKQAEQWNDEAEKVKAEYEKSLAKAQRAAATAASTAERAVSTKISEEQAKFAENSRKRLAAAEQSISKAKSDALASLSDIAAEIAADMAQKVANVQVDKAEAKKAVTNVMKG